VEVVDQAPGQRGEVGAPQDRVDRSDKGAAGLVVDMRDYPAIDQYELVTYLRTETFESPWVHVPVCDGPDDLRWDQGQLTLYPHADAYDGPIALLVGHKTVSAAENFSLTVVPSAQVTVVGQQSASTNGNIAGARLPGAYYGTFTGCACWRRTAPPSTGCASSWTSRWSPPRCSSGTGWTRSWWRRWRC